MANRTTFPAAALDRKVVSLFGKVVFGAAGIVGSTDCLGFAVTKVAATTGIYRCTLEDDWPQLLFADMKLDNAGTAADIKTEINNVDLASKVIDFVLIDGAAAADATDTHEAYIRIDLLNTSAPRKGGV
jgi:hypothetical protein